MVLSMMNAFAEPTGKGWSTFTGSGTDLGGCVVANGDDCACVSTATLQPGTCRSNAESKPTIDVWKAKSDAVLDRKGQWWMRDPVCCTFCAMDCGAYAFGTDWEIRRRGAETQVDLERGR